MAKISSPKAATGSKAKTPSTSSKMKAGASKNAVKALVPAKAAKDATVVKTPTSVQFTVNTTRTVTVSGGNVDSMLLRLKAEGMVPQLHEGATEVAQPVARPAIPSGKSTYYTDVASDSTDAADDDDSSLTPSA